jgi:hypothetical protein
LIRRSVERAIDLTSFRCEEPSIDSEACSHPGIVITVATGDSRYLNWDMSKEEAKKQKGKG